MREIEPVCGSATLTGATRTGHGACGSSERVTWPSVSRPTTQEARVGVACESDERVGDADGGDDLLADLDVGSGERARAAQRRLRGLGSPAVVERRHCAGAQSNRLVAVGAGEDGG